MADQVSSNNPESSDSDVWGWGCLGVLLLGVLYYFGVFTWILSIWTAWSYSGQWESKSQDVILVLRKDRTFVLKSWRISNGDVSFSDEDSIIVANTVTVDSDGIQQSGQFFFRPSGDDNIEFLTSKNQKSGIQMSRTFDASSSVPWLKWWYIPLISISIMVISYLILQSKEGHLSEIMDILYGIDSKLEDIHAHVVPASDEERYWEAEGRYLDELDEDEKNDGQSKDEEA